MQQLRNTIQEWKDLGDTLIIGGDWNDDTAAAQWTRFWTEIGLYEPAKKGGRGPESTYNRGSLQVDNIYVLPLLREFEFEIIPITEGVCGADHKAVIFQIPREALGIDQLPQQKYRGRRLKMQDPKVQHRYLKDYKDQCSQQQIFT